MSFQEIYQQQEPFKVSHMGEPLWEVQHQWQPAASNESIVQAQEDIEVPIPQHIQDIWKISDGALLYKSLKAPDWGWRLISTDRYLENQHKWRRKFFDEWQMQYLAIAELLQPHIAVVWESFTNEVCFLDTSSGGMDAIVIAKSIPEFFDKLVEHQGGLYWQW